MSDVDEKRTGRSASWCRWRNSRSFLPPANRPKPTPADGGEAA
jgi:hypothetical protein